MAQLIATLRLEGSASELRNTHRELLVGELELRDILSDMVENGVEYKIED